MTSILHKVKHNASSIPASITWYLLFNFVLMLPRKPEMYSMVIAAQSTVFYDLPVTHFSSNCL